MPFHHEWAWYNINYPNPDGAICRLGMDDGEWQRMTRWRDFDWFQAGGHESYKILVSRESATQPAPPSRQSKSSPHLLPPAGIPSSSHARRHPSFYYELFYRMLQERECLVKEGLLPPDIPPPWPAQCPKHPLAGHPSCPMTSQEVDRRAQMCKCAAQGVIKQGWLDRS